MSFDRDDFYSECKDYCTSIELIQYMDDYWKYDAPDSLINAIKAKCYQTIEFYENKYHNRVLRE